MLYILILLCSLIWINELLDIPHMVFGAEQTRVNWQEALIETLIILGIGIYLLPKLVPKKRTFRQREKRLGIRRILPPVFSIFASLCFMVWFDEIFDIPSRFIFGMTTPINWIEATAETILIGIVGLYLVFIYMNTINERNMANDLFFRGFSFNPIPTSITSIPEDILVQANDAFVQLTGHDRSDLIERPLGSLNLWTEPIKHSAVVKDIIQKGSVRDVEVELLDVGGEIHHCLYSAELITYDQEPYILSMTMDITKRKAAEELLQKAEARYRNMVENTFNGVAVFKPLYNGTEFVFIDFNKAAEKIDHIQRREVIGKTILQVFPGAKEFGLVDVLHRVWKTGQSEHFPLLQYRDERIVGWRQNFVYKLPSGEIVSVYSDETARKNAEDELRKSERKFSKVFHASPDWITLSTLKEGIYIDVNDTFLSSTGYSLKEVLGRSSIELGIWDDSEKRDEIVKKMLINGGISNEEVLFHTKQGRSRNILWSAERIDFGGENCILSVGRDITEHKLLESELRQSQKMKAIGQLASGIAHDFNNLLTAINGYCELMRNKVDNGSELSGYIDKISKIELTAESLVRQLLAFGRKQALLPCDVNLNEIVFSMKSLLARFIRKDIELVINLDPELGIARADVNQMEQVIMNLVLNARDAMADGGKVVIQTSNIHCDEKFVLYGYVKPGDYVRLTITDTGSGMDEETSAHVFEPFFTTKESGKGTGLGLSTVYGIIKQSGGEIVLTSEPGKGSTFNIFIPRVFPDHKISSREKIQ